METRSPWTLSTRARRWFDRLLVLGLLGFCLLTEVSGRLSEAVHLTPLACMALMGAQVVPLWWRRSHATAVTLTVVAFHALQVIVIKDPLVSQLAFPIAIYSGTRWGPAWLRYGAVPISLLSAFVAGWRWSYWSDDLRDALPTAITCAMIALAAWALGIAGGQRDRFLDALVERAENLERMAERDVALAAQDERARIAREMHDVVAHGLSVIVVQADGARYAAAKDPQVAVDTLETVAATGRESLQEMRRLLGLLRTGESGVRPQPTLADIQHLVAEAVASGTSVDTDLPDPLPATGDGVGLAAYRFVQEALTNVRKHAGPGAAVDLRMVVEGATLVVTVEDDGRGAASSGPGQVSGLGLVGMRERVGVHGGEVTAGPRLGGGWSVGARIPL